MMPSIEDPDTKPGGANVTITTIAPPSPIFAAAPPRSRRKSAKAAAAFVAATVKEEMLLPDYEPLTSSKRSYLRGNSQGSNVSADIHTTNDGSSSHHATYFPCASTTATTPLKKCKGHPKKKTALSSFAVEYLKAWMMSPNHIEHPYPTEDEKVKIMKETHIELKQLTNWFVNNRKRYWKPKVEELRRQSLAGGVTLQDLAAQAQRHMSPAMVAAAVASGSGAASGGCGKTSTDKNGRTGNGNSSSSTVMTTVVSSEGEESLHSHPPKEQSIMTATKASLLVPSSVKKRKKYSVAADKVKRARNLGCVKKSKANLQHGPVANPIVHPLPPATTNNQQQQSEVGFMAVGIHTANTYESVKTARKMSRTISEQDSESEGEGTHERHSGHKTQAVVSNPLAAPLNARNMANAINSAVATSFITNTTTTGALRASVPAIHIPPSLPSTSNNEGGGENTQKQLKQQPDLQLLHRPTPNANLLAMADLLDYSISPLDNQVVANTSAASQAVMANSVGFCCHVMPHDCNLADPMGAKNCFASPCALCSACRDWNLGEFCPWDLTGIIGDISTDAEMVPVSSSSSSSSSLSERNRTTIDNNVAFTALKAASSISNIAAATIVTTSTSSLQDNFPEEATTITRNVLTEVADVASIDEGTNSLCENDEILKLPNAVPMMVGAVMTLSPSNASFLIPAEIGHLTSSDTVDLISSTVDFETSWDLRESSVKRAEAK